MKVLCKEYHINIGLGGGGFTQGFYYIIDSMYKNKGHELMVTFIDDLNDQLQLPLSEVEKVFDLTKGTLE